jgi:Holliday junction DNA helicase RuvA
VIAHLRGRLLEKHPTRLVIEAGGVGLEVLVPLPTSQGLGDPGSEVALHTVLVVREDALTLYGFLTREERVLFLKLVSVSGIGPKIALNALSGSSPRDLAAALKHQDLVFLTRLPGIGKKTAERMALELKDALADLAGEPEEPGARAGTDAVEALVSLGYKRGPAAEAVEKAAKTEGADADVESLVRVALGLLVGGRGGR